jgi:hypothetical protein
VLREEMAQFKREVMVQSRPDAPAGGGGAGGGDAATAAECARLRREVDSLRQLLSDATARIAALEARVGSEDGSRDSPAGRTGSGGGPSYYSAPPASPMPKPAAAAKTVAPALPKQPPAAAAPPSPPPQSTKGGSEKKLREPAPEPEPATSAAPPLPTKPGPPPAPAAKAKAKPPSPGMYGLCPYSQGTSLAGYCSLLLAMCHVRDVLPCASGLI